MIVKFDENAQQWVVGNGYMTVTHEDKVLAYRTWLTKYLSLQHDSMGQHYFDTTERELPEGIIINLPDETKPPTDPSKLEALAAIVDGLLETALEPIREQITDTKTVGKSLQYNGQFNAYLEWAAQGKPTPLDPDAYDWVIAEAQEFDPALSGEELLELWGQMGKGMMKASKDIMTTRRKIKTALGKIKNFDDILNAFEPVLGVF